MAGTVKAVAAHAVLAVQHLRQGIAIGVFRQALVERGVEYRDVWQRRKRLLSGADPHQVGRIVQWGQGDTGFDAGNHLIVDDHGAGEFLATVHDAMTNREKVFKQVRFFGQDLVDDKAQRFVVSGSGPEIGDLFLRGHFPLDAGFRQVQAFCQPREFFFAAGGIDHGEFQG